MKKKTAFILISIILILGIVAAALIPILKRTSPSDVNPTPSSSPESEPPKPTKAELLLEKMTLEQKVYQMFIVRPEQILGSSNITSTPENSAELLSACPVGGIVLFAKNIETPEQCTSYISDIQSASEISLFVAVDEEGGKVARLGNNPAMGTTGFPAAGSTKSEADAYNMGFIIGSEIKQFGFNLDFAPVADVNSNPKNPVIGTRAFSSNPQTAALYISAAVKGFNDSKMLCTLKHFPGHGDTVADSHMGYTEILKTKSELENCELIPFKSGITAGAPFVMLGHIALPTVTGNNLPATLSEPIISMLKNDMGFNGIIITDSFEMGAITKNYSADKAAVMAVSAGVDIILMPEDLSLAASGVTEAVKKGEITEERINESVLKILELKLKSGIIK